MTDLKKLIRENISLAQYTTFKIGGNARYFAQPASEEEIIALLRWARLSDIPYYILGSGSNMLISDYGYDGLVISLDSSFNRFELQSDNILYAQSGAMLTKISSYTCRIGYRDLLFACGIPGTMGGGLVMNAGINTGELKDVVVDMRALDRDLNEVVLTNEQAGFGYRTSGLRDYFILSARVELKDKSEPEKIAVERTELLIKRKKSQPNNYPNAGSIFKNPPGDYAGRLIEAVGLKGAQAGDAMISELHANFIINYTGDATAHDVYTLMRQAQEAVRTKFGVELQPEVKLLGRFE